MEDQIKELFHQIAILTVRMEDAITSYQYTLTTILAALGILTAVLMAALGIYVKLTTQKYTEKGISIGLEKARKELDEYNALNVKIDNLEKKVMSIPRWISLPLSGDITGAIWYSKMGDQEVHIYGTVQAKEWGYAFAMLPVGYRPLVSTLNFPVSIVGEAKCIPGYIEIFTDGRLRLLPQSQGGIVNFSLFFLSK